MLCEIIGCFVYDRFCLAAPNIAGLEVVPLEIEFLQYLILLWRRETKLAQRLNSFVLVHSEYVSDYLVCFVCCSRAMKVFLDYFVAHMFLL